MVLHKMNPSRRGYKLEMQWILLLWSVTVSFLMLLVLNVLSWVASNGLLLDVISLV